MSRRRRLFGPLLWSVLALGVLELIGLWAWPRLPGWQRWWQARALAAQLGDPSSTIRDAAAHELTLLGADAAQPVLDALRNGNDEARAAACRLLAYYALPRREQFDALVGALGDPHAAVRAAAAVELGNLTAAISGRERVSLLPQLVCALRRNLSDPNARAMSAAIQSLEHLGQDARAAVPALRAALDSESPRVRFHAARALLMIEGTLQPDVRACLWALVNDPNIYAEGAYTERAAQVLYTKGYGTYAEIMNAMVRHARSENATRRLLAIGTLDRMRDTTFGLPREFFRDVTAPVHEWNTAVPALIDCVWSRDGLSRRLAGNVLATWSPEKLGQIAPVLWYYYLTMPPGRVDHDWAEHLLATSGRLQSARSLWAQTLGAVEDAISACHQLGDRTLRATIELGLRSE